MSDRFRDGVEACLAVCRERREAYSEPHPFPDRHEVKVWENVERILRESVYCPDCEGDGVTSHGKECLPCRGTGLAAPGDPP